MILGTCRATIGQVGNAEHANVKLGKAGTEALAGLAPHGTGARPWIPPAIRMAGGEGKAGIGMAAPKTPWGKKALGVRTRRNKRTGQFIIRRRGKRPLNTGETAMSRSLKKGYYIQPKLLEKVERLNQQNKKVVIRTWSRAKHNLSADGRSYDCGPRWPAACADLHHGKYGWAQAGRICAHAHLPRPHHG